MWLLVNPSSENLFLKVYSYFDTCRRKRNILDYDTAQVVTETETKELVQKAEEFRALVEQWIAQHHPQFAP